MELMTGYKKSSLGVIPIDWNDKALGDIGESLIGLTYHPSEVRKYGTLVLRSSNVQNGTLCFGDNVFVETDIPERIMVRPGDILLCVRNGSRDLIGKAALIDERAIGMTFGAFMGVFRSNDGQFLHHVFQSGIFKKQINEHLGATINQITNKSLNSFKVPLPPTNEERTEIAKALSDVDALIAALDQVIAKKRNLKQAAMQQLLTGQTRLPGFSGEWNQCQVQDVVTGFFCGPSPTCEERNIQDDEWGVLKTTATTKERGWDWTKHKTLPRIYWNKPHLELQKGDVIVTKAGPRHRVGVASWIDYVPPRIIVSGKMIGLRPRPERVVSLMLAAAISAHETQTYLDQRTTGMAESQVNFENAALLEAPILLPNIDEQKEIAQALTEMDAELTALIQKRAKTLMLKQGMMQELLTGRTRLV
jgi:type I restriction enzyme S subunit